MASPDPVVSLGSFADSAGLNASPRARDRRCAKSRPVTRVDSLSGYQRLEPRAELIDFVFVFLQTGEQVFFF